ncbi:MAG: glycosyl hydrolase family 28-related protein [Calditrichia bacterium]
MQVKPRQLQSTIVCLLLFYLGCAEKSAVSDSWQPEVLAKAEAGEIYLPDFSYAGYRSGEKKPTITGDVLRVIDFGAVPDDAKDDTRALKEALAKAEHMTGNVVIEFPAGKLLLSDYVYLQRGQLVLRGSGSGSEGTVLQFTKPLSELPLPEHMQELQEYLVSNNKRVKKSQKLFSPFSWTGGYIWIRNKDSRGLAYLNRYDMNSLPASTLSISSAKRGKKHLVLTPDSNTEPLTDFVGKTLKINWFNKDGEGSDLLKHIYQSDVKIGERHWKNSHRPLLSQYVNLEEVEGRQLLVKEPLLHDVRSGWTAEVELFEPLSEIGIEGFSIEFPESDYMGHHLEAGYNAIYLTDVVHSWIKDVSFTNVDNAILSDNAAFVTIEDVVVDGRLGHYAVHLGKTNHMLVKGLRVDAEQMHSISFNTGCKAGVFSDVLITKRPTLDQHCGINHQNLFDNIRLRGLSEKADLFQHGGAGYWKPTHGAYNTFWNIDVKIDLPDETSASDVLAIGGISDGPQARFIGFNSNRILQLDYGPDAYIEGVNQQGLSIASLYNYQLNKRLKN